MSVPNAPASRGRIFGHKIQEFVLSEVPPDSDQIESAGNYSWDLVEIVEALTSKTKILACSRCGAGTREDQRTAPNPPEGNASLDAWMMEYREWWWETLGKRKKKEER